MAQFKPAAIAAAHNRHGVEYVVIIADLADVVRSKEAAGRPNDLAVLPALYRRLRIDVETHEELKRLSRSLGTTVGRTVTLALRALSQDQIGEQLRAPLTPAEAAWLDAELG